MPKKLLFVSHFSLNFFGSFVPFLLSQQNRFPRKDFQETIEEETRTI